MIMKIGCFILLLKFLAILCKRRVRKVEEKHSLFSLKGVKVYLFSDDKSFTYKSLLSGKYYRLLPEGASYNILKRNINLDCVIPDVHCLPDDESFILVEILKLKIFFSPMLLMCSLEWKVLGIVSSRVFIIIGKKERRILDLTKYFSDCSVFTWFDENHSTFPNSCFLYSRLIRKTSFKSSNNLLLDVIKLFSPPSL